MLNLLNLWKLSVCFPVSKKEEENQAKTAEHTIKLHNFKIKGKGRLN